MYTIRNSSGHRGEFVEVTVKTTCPRDCYDSCGMLVTKKADGTLRVAGDPDHPVARGALCAKCGVAYNGVFQDREARLTTALRRAGSPATRSVPSAFFVTSMPQLS